MPRLLSCCECVLMAAVLSGSAVGYGQSETADIPGAPLKPADAERRELSERILQLTQSARDKLAEKQTGTPTQDLQHAAVDDLEKLIELLRTSPPPSSGSGSPPPPESDDSSTDQNRSENSSRKPKTSRKPKSAGTGASEDRSQPQDSEERHGENKESKLRADRKRRLENDIWGHLPPSLREQLLNTYGERMLPQYEDFVKKFYEALSEPARTPQR